jgi:hypothetical protein
MSKNLDLVRSIFADGVGEHARARQHTGPDVVRLLREMNSGGPSDPEAFEQGRALARALAPADAVDLVVRYEAHLTREIGRLLTQLEQARRLSALVDSEHRNR